jgi:diadenosine tetraphosphate (Ap4A) HIT family hydrolase
MDRICPFCAMPAERIIDSDELAVVIRDGFPVTQGHTLIIPRRHVASFFELTEAEQNSILKLLRRAHSLAVAEGVTAFNIGINDGAAAGQTVPHVHVHLIPRRPGDVADPRGGVRWVIGDRARYWEAE